MKGNQRVLNNIKSSNHKINKSQNQNNKNTAEC